MSADAVMEEERLLARFRGLDAAARRSLLDYAEYLASRAAPARPESPRMLPRPGNETVVQAIRRLNHSYPMLGKHALASRVEQLLAEHMMDERPAADVIDQLELFYGERYATAQRPPQ